MAKSTEMIQITQTMSTMSAIFSDSTASLNMVSGAVMMTTSDIEPTSLSEITDITDNSHASSILFRSTDISWSSFTEPHNTLVFMHDAPAASVVDYVTSSMSSVISSSTSDINQFTQTPSVSHLHSSNSIQSHSEKTSASQTISDVYTKTTIPITTLGSTATIPSIFTTSSTESTTRDSSGLMNNPTALYIAIPVCFLIILIAVGLSYLGFNKRKNKQRWNSSNERRNLWLNPTSDISLPINSETTVTIPVTPEPLSDDKAIIINKTPSNKDPNIKGCINIYRVVYQFEAQLDSQISLQPDEVISVVEQAENGWFRGEVLGRSGWFPSSYVEEIKPPSIKTLEKVENVENETSLKKKSHVTSFLLKKRPEKHRKRSRNKQNDEAEHIDSEIDSGIVAEVINMNDIGSIIPLDIDDITKTSPGKFFKAVFAYKASCKGEIALNEGDVVTCLERDRNGWMKGHNLRTNEDGWFPAVYVNEASEDDIPIMVTPKPVTYDQLIANKNRNSNQDAIGIEHKAIYAFTASKDEDLSFEIGDTIVVFETLDNGWWLGCKGEEVGWLPGSYVELVDKSDDSSSNASSSLKNFSIFDEMEVASLKSNRNSSYIVDNETETQTSSKTPDKSEKIKKRESQTVLSADFRPARKAPPPPSFSTPISPKTKAESESKQYLTDNNMNNKADSVKPSGKPELPVRFAKPKVVKVPRKSTKKLRNLAGLPQPSERPLPPRPPPPKIINQSKYKKYNPKDHSKQSNTALQNGISDSQVINLMVEKRKTVPPKPPSRYQVDESSETKTNEIDVSMSSNDESLNNSVGPTILNRISAHLLDEISDNSPKLGSKQKRLRKVAPPVLPPPTPERSNETVLELDGTINNHNEINNEMETIKVQKPTVSPKPPPPTSPPPKSHQIIPDNSDTPSTTKRTNLRIAVRSYQGVEEGELSFEEGSFIMDIEEECSRPEWCVGMLADGTTGIYPVTHVGSSRSQLQTEL